MRSITSLLSAIFMIETIRADAGHGYNYQGIDWGETCKIGLKQSPINIPIESHRTREELKAVKNNSNIQVQFNYVDGDSLTVVNTGITFKALDIDGTIQFNN